MLQNDPLRQKSIWCVVPVYNNKDTVRKIVSECRAILPNVVVVDDGSTDADVPGLLEGLDVVVLKHEKNFGKGRAILTASHFIEGHNGRFMITIDADGQHCPRDMKKFFPLLQEGDPAILIGARDFNTKNVPASSRFGRSFANFWLLVETGKVVADCQSGFRAYPVQYLNQLQFRGSHYDFEAEVLARAAWAGLELKTVNISVVYPKPEDRVSSFRPFLDNLRLTHMHAMLFWRRLLPIGHARLVEKKPRADWALLRHPGKVLKALLRENATPEGLALSAAVGMFLAVLPLLFVHTVVILYIAVRLKLNKIVALNVQHLAVPPFIPALCIEVGYYMRHGTWLTDLSFKTVFEQFSSRVYEWFLGSLVIAPLAAVLVGAVMFITAAVIKRVRYASVPNE
jgi:glycosyltransferase involved in cell wall biosynthesis